MVGELFTTIGEVVSNFVATLTSAINGLTAIVYDSTNGLTFIGVLLICAVGMGIVYWVFRLIRGCVAGLAR